MSAEYDRNMRHLVDELLAVTLTDAASDSNEAARDRRAIPDRQILDGRNMAVEASISRFADAAGHVNDDIGVLYRVNLGGTERFEHPVDAFGVVLVHLASECLGAKCEAGEIYMHAISAQVRRAVKSRMR